MVGIKVTLLHISMVGIVGMIGIIGMVGMIDLAAMVGMVGIMDFVNKQYILCIKPLLLTVCLLL